MAPQEVVITVPHHPVPHAGTAVYFGRRALRLGDARGRLPLVVALVVATGFVLLNGLSALAIFLS